MLDELLIVEERGRINTMINKVYNQLALRWLQHAKKHAWTPRVTHNIKGIYPTILPEHTSLQ